MKSAAMPRGVLLTTRESLSNVRSCRPLHGRCPAQGSLSTFTRVFIVSFLFDVQIPDAGVYRSCQDQGHAGGTAAQAGLVPVGRGQQRQREQVVTSATRDGQGAPSPVLRQEEESPNWWLKPLGDVSVIRRHGNEFVIEKQ